MWFCSVASIKVISSLNQVQQINMSRVFVDEQLSWVIQAKCVLDDAQIPCYIKNEFASSTAGEVPFLETWPELWVHKQTDSIRAKQLIDAWQATLKATQDTTFEPWKCSQCGELNEGNFALCWSCGKVLDPITD